MSYKNSVKLLTTNFSLVWKQLAYMLIICLLAALLGYGFSVPTINLLKEHNIIEEFKSIFETIYTAPNELVSAISNTFVHFTEVIIDNFGKVWFSLLSSIIVVQVFYQILKNISHYNLVNLMYYQMTSFVEIGYTRNLIASISQSFKYAIARFVYKLPFAILKFTTIFIYCKIATTPIGIFAGLFFTSTILILLSSFELCLFSGMTGVLFEQINNNLSPFKAFFKGNLYVFQKFPRVFSNSIITTLTIIVVNVFLGVFTLGSGLLITLPATMLLKAIFELCSYFGIKGERYYLTKTIIATPLKDEENEKINNIK